MTSARDQQPPFPDVKQAHLLLNQFCKNIHEWPDSWAGSDRDLPIGENIVREMTPFLLDRIQKGRAKNTIKIYANYLWALGGELIRRINEDETERKWSAKQLILQSIDDSGGPYWRHARDDLDRMRYDSVCKGLFRFMTKSL